MRLLFILLINISLVACGQKAQVEEVKDSKPIEKEITKEKDSAKKKNTWEEVSNDGVTLDYPSEWKVDISGKQNTSIAIFPNSELAESGFKDNINLMIQNAPSDMTLDSWGDMIDEGNKKREGYELLKSNKKTLKRTEILNLEYKVTRDGYDLKFKQYFIIKNGKAYNLTFAADQKTYTKNIIKTIRLFNSIDIASTDSASANKNIRSMDNKESNQSWKNYRQAGISMNFPDEWRVEKSPKEKIVWIAFPKGEKTKRGFKDNLNVVVQNDSGGKLTTEYWADAIDKGNQKNENYKLITSRKKRLGALDIHEVIFDSTTQGYNLRYFQYLIVKDKKAYNLTFTAEQSTYKSNLDDVENIFNSFKII